MADPREPRSIDEHITEFIRRVPHDRVHMLHYFAMNAAAGRIRPFVLELANAITTLDEAVPSLGITMIDRLAAIRGIGVDPFEAIVQVMAEIYVAEGAVRAADRDDDGRLQFHHEPGASQGKNPEFEARAEGLWYAVEAKTPRLIKFGLQRAEHGLQLTARLPGSDVLGPATLPRDNPVKDFLASAEEKFAAYERVRPGTSTILSIVWDDFVQEAVSALLHPRSGLFTDHSFAKDSSGLPLRFAHVDGVLLIRHQHNLIRATREEPLIDNQGAFRYHGPDFPPKVIIPNPFGARIPPQVVSALGATPIDEVSMFAEYRPQDLILWVGGNEGLGGAKRD